VIQAYKSQAQAEGGFRFLTEPLFFVSSLFVKKPSRIQGLLTVMTFALLVYSVAQRRLRQHLVRHNETVLNQINQPTERPTLRWVFQLLEGIHRVRVMVQGEVLDLIEGLNEVRNGGKITYRYTLTAGLPSSSILGGLRQRQLACVF